MPKGDRPNRFKIIPKEDVEKEIMLGKQLAPSKQYNFSDLTGQTLADGNITVIGRYREKSADDRTQWICKCNLCGNYFYSTGKSLRKGNAKSCGCLVSKKCAERNTKFGLIDTELGYKLYHIHHDMIRRCYNPNRMAYKDYGGRGIYIVPEWYTPGDPMNRGFVNFYNWMVEHGYYLGCKLSIDRIDNDGPYAPWNCRLVGIDIQSRNRRNNRFIIDRDGETLNYVDFEIKHGLRESFISSSLYNPSGLITLDLIVHNTQFDSIEDMAHFNKARGEYIDKNGFIHLIDMVNDLPN